MFLSNYQSQILESSGVTRDQEDRAFERSIELLRSAQGCGPGSREAIEAIHYVVALWKILLEDLASTENRLPSELKAGLISIGVWILRRSEDIRAGRSADFSVLIDVTETIRGGLR